MDSAMLLGMGFGLVFVGLCILAYWIGKNQEAIKELERRVANNEEFLKRFT